jgi:hypothetical protein
VAKATRARINFIGSSSYRPNGVAASMSGDLERRNDRNRLKHSLAATAAIAIPARFRAKACPVLDAGRMPVRVKKTRQNKRLEHWF